MYSRSIQDLKFHKMELIYHGLGVQLYFCTFLVSTFLQNHGRLEQKYTLKMYKTSEISRTYVLNANYIIFSKIYFFSVDFSHISGQIPHH